MSASFSSQVGISGRSPSFVGQNEHYKGNHGQPKNDHWLLTIEHWPFFEEMFNVQWSIASIANRHLLPEKAQDFAQRIEVAVNNALFHRDDRVVGDGDVLGTDFRTALRDVAISDALRRLQLVDAILHIERMKFQSGDVHEKSRSDKVIMKMMVAKNVTDVLTKEALNAFAEFLHAVHVFLHHSPRPV
jgi:hypothetical protein